MFVRDFRIWILRLFQLWEIVVYVAAVFAGLVALQERGTVDLRSLATPLDAIVMAGLTGLWTWLLHSLSLYSSRRLVNRSNEVLTVLAAIVIAAGFMALLGALLELPFNQAPFLIGFILISGSLMIVGRTVGRMLLRSARARGHDRRFVAVVGAGTDGQALARRLLSDPSKGVRLLGIFDDGAALAELPEAFRRGGTLDDLTWRMMRERVDEVLIATPISTHYDQVIDTIERCRRVGVCARVVGDFLAHEGLKPTIEFIGDLPSLHFSQKPEWGWQGQVKRAIDVVVSAATLLIFSPLLVGIAVAIKLDSPGPVFFSQLRVGRNKRHFRLYKFRTMRADAEQMQVALEALNEAAGPVFKMRHDPRVTRLGRLLRRYSLDELPQLVNVLRGEMSLVGPRPLPLRDVEKFVHDWHSRRFSVRPGLTCSWVLAGRSELDFDKWVMMDLDYIDNWSLAKDLKICLHTIPSVLKGAGAY